DCQPVRSHGTSPATTPGAITRKSVVPAAARSRVDRTRQGFQIARRLDAPESRDKRERKARTPGAALGHDDGAEPQLPHQPLPVLTGLGGDEDRPPPTTCDGVAVRLEAEGELLHVVVRAARDPDHSVLSHIQESAPGRRRYTSAIGSPR